MSPIQTHTIEIMIINVLVLIICSTLANGKVSCRCCYLQDCAVTEKNSGIDLLIYKISPVRDSEAELETANQNSVSEFFAAFDFSRKAINRGDFSCLVHSFCSQKRVKYGPIASYDLNTLKIKENKHINKENLLTLADISNYRKIFENHIVIFLLLSIKVNNGARPPSYYRISNQIKFSFNYL